MTAEELEQEKCELLGIIQDKDKVIKDLEEQLQEMVEDNDYYQEENEKLEKENAVLKTRNAVLENRNVELKAGKPQWHDLRKDPNDLPKRDERFYTNISTSISVAVITQTGGFAFYSFDDKEWYFQGKKINVIAWCEIPQFKE